MIVTMTLVFRRDFRVACIVALLICEALSVISQNKVLDLTTDSAYVEFGGSAALKPTDQITFGLWANHADWQSIENQPTLFGNTQHTGFAISLIKEDLVGWIAVDSVYKTLEYPTKFLTSGWHHFAVNFDGRQMQLVIDGVVRDHLKWEERRPVAQPDSTITLMLGAETRYNGQPHQGFFFDGLIDDAFIFSQFLTSDELRKLKQGRNPIDQTSLQLWLGFENHLDSTVLDASSKNNTGTIRNGGEIKMESFPRDSLITIPPAIQWTLLLFALLAALLPLRFKTAQRYRIFQLAALLLFLNYALSRSNLYYPLLEAQLWNIQLAHALFCLALGLLLRATQFSPNKTRIRHLPIVILFTSPVFLFLPVGFYQWLTLILLLVGIGWMTLFFIEVKLKWLLAGLGGLVTAFCLYALEFGGFLYLDTEAPFQASLSFFLIVFGFLPMLQLVSKPDITLTSDAVELLSKKETEVAKLIALGKTDIEIAGLMKLSPNTIKTYNKRIYGKLTLTNRRDIVRFVKEES